VQEWLDHAGLQRVQFSQKDFEQIFQPGEKGRV
jgi:hypothetical protein